ncbi:hypothetical protein [Streptomyces sp. KR55]
MTEEHEAAQVWTVGQLREALAEYVAGTPLRVAGRPGSGRLRVR